jgi:hypothetical protein
MSMNQKPRGSTPITSRAVPSIISRRPTTAGSPPYRRIQ